MFSAPVYVSRGDGAILDYMIKKLHHLTNNDENIKENDKCKLQSVWSEVYDLVSKGNYVSEKVSKLLPEDILKKREDYLSSLKQIVCDSIEKGVIEDVAVERDNVFYCVKCPEKSIITPVKFMNNPEFRNLDGALKVGEGNDVIRIKNGQYHDMKGKVKMTFKVGDDEKIEMILSSKNDLSFGEIKVRMDDKSYKVFLKHCEELKKELRISKVIEAAKSFVQPEGSEVGSSPLSSMDDTNVQQLQSNVKETVEI
ncbi:MAG: hypothetical protein ACR5LA_11485 [Wolbachia sp.]